MRYLALLGFAICQFSFAQIANFNLASAFNPCFKVPDLLNQSPLHFFDQSKLNLSLNHTWLFSETDITLSNISCAYQSKSNRFTGQLQYDGTPDYSNTTIQLGFAKKLNQTLSMCVGYQFSKIASTENIAQNYGYFIGGNYQINKNTSLSVIHSRQFKDQSQSIAYNFKIGSNVYSAIALTTLNFEPIAKAHLIFKPYTNFLTSISMGNGPTPFSGLLCFQKANWGYSLKMNYYNNNLGFQPSFYLNYLINEQKSSNGAVGIDHVHKSSITN